MIPDPRTLHFLEHELGGTSINQRKINDMAVNLVLREIYQDEINNLQEHLTNMQRQFKSRTPLVQDMYRSGSDSGDSGRSTPQRPGTAVLRATQMSNNSAGSKTKSQPAQQGELTTIIRQKDDIIRKKDDEYVKLRQILEDTQNDLQSVLDLNSQYLTIISQLNQMQFMGANTPRNADKSEALEDLENQLEESQAHIERLQIELGGISSDLTSKEKELESVLKRERKYKRMLDLDDDADDDMVEERLRKMKEEGSLHKNELDKIKKELEKTTKVKNDLENVVSVLTREKDKVEFHVRQQELTIKKMKRMKMASHTIQAAETMLAVHTSGSGLPTQLKLPSIDRPGSQLSLQSTKSTRTSHQYCMFCRQEYQPLKNKGCRAHFRPIRNGKWTCCHDDCHRSIGCLQIPHFYVEITVDKKVFITDGAKYMEVS